MLGAGKLFEKQKKEKKENENEEKTEKEKKEQKEKEIAESHGMVYLSGVSKGVRIVEDGEGNPTIALAADGMKTLGPLFVHFLFYTHRNALALADTQLPFEFQRRHQPSTSVRCSTSQC